LDSFVTTSFFLSIGYFSTGVSLDSLGRSSVFSVLIGSHFYDSGVDSASNTVLHFNIELGYDVSFEGSVFLKILFRGGINNVSDSKAFDSFVLGTESAAVDADYGFDEPSVVFVSAVVSSLDRHVANYIRIYLLI